MRLVSRWSSVLAATALVGTSFTLAVPALAVDLPVGDPEVAATEPAEEVAPDENAEVGSPGEEAPVEEVPAEEGPAQVPGTSDIAPQDASENPTIAEVRAGADGVTVTTEGWVTAAYPTGGLHGFVIQTAGSGGPYDLATPSDAIFVYTNHSNNVAPTPEVGKYVTVTGTIATFNGLRQISTSPASSAGSKIQVVTDTTGIAPAKPATGAWPKTDAERTAIQSMLYTPSSDAGFAVTDNYNANSYGTLGISVTGEPLRQPSDVTADTAKRAEIATSNAANLFVLDDGATTRFAGGNATNNKLVPPYVSAEGATAVGAKVAFTEPLIVDYRNNAWTLNPTHQIETTTTEVTTPLPATFTHTRPAAPGNLGGDIVVGGFNLENYFPTTLGGAWAAAHPGAGCTSYKDNTGAPVAINRCSDVVQDGLSVSNPRGAWDEANLARQTDSIVKAINDLDASALGVMELENSYKMSFGDASKAGASAAYLVAQLNAAAGTEKWAYVTPEPSEQEPIAEQDVMYPGIIYQPAKVTAIEDGQLTLSELSGAGDAFSNGRAPFGQLFKPTAGGEPFFLVANHFKSKSSPGAGDEADLGEGGWNASRTAQANALVTWVNGEAKAELKARTGYTVEDSVLVGDFNSYTFEKPMTDMYAAGFTNVNIVDGQLAGASYSYSGLNGSLDHVLISDSASDRATGHAIWNINAPEQIGLHYSRYNYTGGEFVQKNLGKPVRASDHDPAVVGLKAGKNVVATDDLTILNINDFHGRIDGTLSADKSAITASSTINFAYTVDSLRNQAPYENSLFLSAGDNVGASLFASALAKDQPTIDLLNALGMEASAVGNHEFDAGWADLRDRLAKEFDGILLGANVYKEGTTTPVLPEYATFTAGGQKVAVIGVVTQDTPTLVNPDNVAGLTFGDPVDAVNRVADKLENLPAAYRPDIIIAEYHEGAAAVSSATTLQEKIDEGGIFARIVTETSAAVDAIFNGHTHQVYTWDGPVPGVDGATRPIVSTGQYGTNVGKVVLSVGRDSGAVEDYSMEIVNVVGFAGGRTIADMVDGNQTMEEIYGITLEALQVADAEGAVPVGKITQTLSRDYTKGEYVDGKWQKGTTGAANNRDGESPMGILVGNMLRDGQMATLPNAPDFGVTNPGGLRTDFNYGTDGTITVAGARAVLPFNNNLSIAQMTGEQIVKMLEQQWQRDASGAVPSRSYLQLGLSDNISYTYHEYADPAKPGYTLGVIDSVTLDGQPLVMDQTYNVGTFEFLAAGGDNFFAFRDATVIDTGLVDWESWLDYLSVTSGAAAGPEGTTVFETPIAPDFTSRAVAVEGMPEEGLVAGQEVTLTFRDINVQAVGAPENKELKVALAGTDIGTFPITRALLEDGNWTDSATVTFTVPAGFGGEGSLVATATPTDTVIVVPARSESSPEPVEPNVRRVAGENRYATNLAVNNVLDHEKGGVVFVASGTSFPDALSAGPAVAVNDGALFLTASGSLSADSLAKIRSLEPSKVYIVGGAGVVSSNVVAQLRDATDVFPLRIAGANRYETSAKVFQTFFSGRDVDRAFVATGLAYPDGLSASAAAGALDAPVLLVNGASGTNILSESAALLKRLGTDNIVIAGGSGAVNTRIESNLKKDFTSITRLAGANRYATNMAVNAYVNENVGDIAMTGVWVATGTDFPDALSAAPGAGDPTQRLVLSNGKCISKPVVSEWITGAGSQVEMTTLVGGVGVLPNALMKLPECK